MLMWLVILYNIVFLSSVSATNIGTFQEQTCAKSLRNRDGPNGYPDGTCTALNLEPIQSFQVVGLDPGCSVTLYANNTESGDNAGKACSSETKIVAQLAECYNSTWIYYSIDGCDIPSRLPSSSLTLDTSPQPTLAGPATASRTNPPSVNKPASNTGIIVGGIVGGVSVFAIIFFVALYYMRRRFHQKHDPPIPPRFELSHEQSALAELAYAEKPPKTELYAHEPATEMGRNSVYVPPVELPGDAVVGNDKKGMNPLIKVHFSEGNNEKAP